MKEPTNDRKYINKIVHTKQNEYIYKFRYTKIKQELLRENFMYKSTLARSHTSRQQQ